MSITTYRRYQRSDLGVSEEEWAALKEYVTTIREAIEQEVTQVGGIEEVEENPPSVDGDTFKPWGWVGHFPGDVVVEPSHLSEEEYTTILTEIQRWVETIGATTIEASLPLSTDILIDARTRLSAYSEVVIELTEAVQSHRFPVEVHRTRHKGYSPKGRPLFEQTLQEAARGTRRVVSEEITFTFDTLLNHLLVRFHIELLSEMRELAAEYQYYTTAFSSQIKYHEQFLNSDIPRRLTDQAIRTEFSDPSIIAQTRRKATDTMAEVVDLWEAFQRDIAMELSISNRLNTAVKPMSKLYELWCLGILIKLLSEMTESSRETRSPIDKTYRFDHRVKLHYNRSLGHFSRYLRPNLSVSSGEPDFAVEVDDELIWIGDAKYKTQIRGSDYRRFIPYLIDLISPEQPSTMLYLAREPKSTEYVRDYPIGHETIRPDTRESSQCSLRQILNEAGVPDSSS